ncbi:MAG: PepSY domain-containing protein [Verrucomicrobia bacterium]|nr:PepSY domain-containing protein [Verrucomicrobiota bacterium]
MSFRKVFFWLHLVAGLVAGLSIGIMCFTGTTLAFESELVSWSERSVRRVTPPQPDAPRLSLDVLQKNVREYDEEAKPTGIIVSADPAAAVVFSLGRDGALYVNPYTGEVKESPESNWVHDFLHLMEDWHRVLGRSGDSRPIGKAINGACNLAFFFLAASGLYLWWPRSWSWRGFKAIAVINLKSSGKARDFNWHNAIGLWCAPVLIVLTLTAVPISYRWGSNLVYQLVGEEPPVQQGPGAAPAAPSVDIPKPPEGTRPLGYAALLAAVRQTAPDAELITFRLGGLNRAQRPSGANASNARPAGESAQPPAQRRGPQPVSVTVKQLGAWPRTATTTLTLNPYTGEVLKRETFSDLSAGRRLRTWTRFLHTGQALGWVGQAIAGLACLGGCFLVYTGFALAWRRFFFKKKSAA